MATTVLEVVTPQRRILREEVESVVAPGAEGYLGVWPRHAPLLTTLKPGVLYYRKVGGKKECMAVSGGFMEAGPDNSHRAGRCSGILLGDQCREGPAGRGEGQKTTPGAVPRIGRGPGGTGPGEKHRPAKSGEGRLAPSLPVPLSEGSAADPQAVCPLSGWGASGLPESPPFLRG